MSKAVSARYGVYCPTCKAKPFTPCRTLKSGRVTDTHMTRIDESSKGIQVSIRNLNDFPATIFGHDLRVVRNSGHVWDRPVGV